MTARFLVAPATPDHAASMLKDVRWQDRAEWVAGSGYPTRERLFASVMDPTGFARSVFVTGIEPPLVMWGASPTDEDHRAGWVWLIATNAAVKLARALHTALPSELALLDRRYDRSVAYSDARNPVHHDWLAWLGFEMLGERRMGPWNMPFLHFERTSKPCA